jgi:hypothetical protein
MKYTFVAYGLLLVYTILAWVINLIQFFGCDFDPIGKEEILKGIGMFIPPVSWFTVWI